MVNLVKSLENIYNIEDHVRIISERIEKNLVSLGVINNNTKNNTRISTFHKYEYMKNDLDILEKLLGLIKNDQKNLLINWEESTLSTALVYY